MCLVVVNGMKRRELLKNAGLLTAGSSVTAVGAALESSTDNEQRDFADGEDPTVVFMNGGTKFSLDDDASDVVQTPSMVDGTAVIQNMTDRDIIGEFQTYFLGFLNGEKYGFQGSAEVKAFDADSSEEVSIKTELNGEEEFELHEYMVVFVAERNP